jgi:HK97 family phage prohead protease
MPGTFDRAVVEKHDVRALFNHNPDYLLGRVGAGTLTLSVDSRGLLFSLVPPDTQVGRDVLAWVQRGDITGASFSFVTTDETWVKESGKRIRQVRGVKLFDVGPVTFPAYTGTVVSSRSQELARSLDRRQILSRLQFLKVKEHYDSERIA